MDHAAITSAAGCQRGILTFDGEGSMTVLEIVERNADIIAATIMRADAKMDRIDLKRFVERVKVTRAKFRNRHTISFSQYGEDTILWHLNPQSHGFYIDVGAYHPRILSNTYKLYLKGWSGITIEPNPDVADMFRRVRPRDLHLNIGVSRTRCDLTYYRFEHSELNSFDREQASRMRTNVLSCLKVSCLPLSEVVQQHAAGHRIDLLSVDCEGLDLSVLESLDWTLTRPVAVIVEDFEQFDVNKEPGGVSQIRRFLARQDYAQVAQAIFSFIYVDRRAFFAPVCDEGFRLDQSQLVGIAHQRCSSNSGS
jgi:FkbM family methyltransferase